MDLVPRPKSPGILGHGACFKCIAFKNSETTLAMDLVPWQFRIKVLPGFIKLLRLVLGSRVYKDLGWQAPG